MAQPPDPIPRWARIGVYLVTAALGTFMLVYATLDDTPSLLIATTGLVLLGAVPAAAFDRWLRGGK